MTRLSARVRLAPTRIRERVTRGGFLYIGCMVAFEAAKLFVLIQLSR